ncbi:hypothetical protein Q7C36_002879 [Tachysurus vachellii]|uniref:Uncharacterized protein n=1 Tax=Tachysurus vachellii TaxID=175792 RepID=A0AA88NT02_TACVA|nr:hypothetical protein Q7C36_002879 [Tachysurus vachellii]
MKGPIEKVRALLTALCDQPGEAALPTVVTPQREQPPSITEFPPLVRNWYSPRKKQDSGQKNKKRNPAVAEANNIPDMFGISVCPETQVSTTSKPVYKSKPSINEAPLEIVVVHPENPNPHLNEVSEEENRGPQAGLQSEEEVIRGLRLVPLFVTDEVPLIVHMYNPFVADEDIRAFLSRYRRYPQGRRSLADGRSWAEALDGLEAFPSLAQPNWATMVFSDDLEKSDLSQEQQMVEEAVTWGNGRQQW